MVHLITGGRNSGKTTKLKEIYTINKGFGFCSQKVVAQHRVIGYDLVSLDEKYRFEFIREHDIEFSRNNCFCNKRYAFDLTVIEQIEKLILESKEKNIYLDEIGKLELVSKKGFYELVINLIKKDINLYMTVNCENIDTLKRLINKKCHIINLQSIGVVIMASGYSNRFGVENKLLHDENGKTIFENVLENTIHSNLFSEVIVVTQYNAIKNISSKYHQVEVVDNNHANLGISESIKLGTAHMKPYIDGYIYIPADQLYLSFNTLRCLVEAFKKNNDKIVIPLFNNVVGSPKIFPASLKEELLSINGDVGGRQVVNNNKEKIVTIKFNYDKDNLDINTLEDLNGGVNET